MKAKWIISSFMLRTKDTYIKENVVAVSGNGIDFISNRPYWTFDATVPACIV